MKSIIIILTLINIVSLRGSDAQLIANSLNYISGLLNTGLQFVLGQNIVGLDIGQYVNMFVPVAVNSIFYYLNGFRFSKPIEELVNFYCWKRDSSELVLVTINNITTVTIASKGYFFIIHGWLGSKDTYYIRELIDGEILRIIRNFYL